MGQKNGIVVKSTSCSSRGPGFISQNLHGSSYLSVPLVPGDLTPFWPLWAPGGTSKHPHRHSSVSRGPSMALRLARNLIYRQERSSLLILLPPLSECWGYKCHPLCLASAGCPVFNPLFGLFEMSSYYEAQACFETCSPSPALASQVLASQT